MDSTVLTNIYNLPAPIVQAVANDDYSPGHGDISVTQLLDPPRKFALTAEYKDWIKEDVSDRIFSIFGQAVHTILERSDVPGLQEERLYGEWGGWTVSGQFDYIDEDGVLWDWKTASTYELQTGVKESRAEQLNCYAALARYNGLTITGSSVGFLLRDWSRRKATFDPAYPQHQVVVYPIELWTPDEQDRFIEERVRLHQEARENLPDCTDEERWMQPTKYAVMKEGGKRAVKLFDDETEAIKFANGKGNEHYVETRPGVNTRCELYCQASQFCTQWDWLRQ